MNKKVVMLLSNGFSPDPRVLREAKSILKGGYDVTIYAWDREKKYKKTENYEGINIQRIQIKSQYGRGSSQVLMLLIVYCSWFFQLLFKKYDVIHCHDFDTLPVGFILGKIKRCNIVYDSHEQYVDMLTNVSGGIKKIITSIETFIIKRVQLITVGEILGNHFKERGAKQVTIVGNWQDLESFNIAPAEITKKKQMLQLEGKIVISYIGFLNKDRKVLELIDSLGQRADNCVALIGGLGTMAGEVQSRISSSKRAIWLGQVPNKEIPLYTCISDVIYYCLNPDIPISKYSAPNKLFEALAAGKPIISLNIGEIGKIVSEERCGTTIKDCTNEAINRAIDDLIKNYALYSSNSRKLGVSKYNWAISEERLLTLYRGMN